MSDAPTDGQTPPRRHKSRLVSLSLWIGTALLVFAIGALINQIKNRPKPEPEKAPAHLANVAVETVRAQEYIQAVELPARLEADRSVPLAFQIPGRIEEWLVEEGGTVEKGQTIARLNTDELDAALAELQVQLRSAKTQRDLAERDLVRARKLEAENIVAEAEIDIAATAFDQGRIEVERTERAIARIRVSLDRASLTAPFPGRLESHLLETGAVVAIGDPVGVLYDLAHVRALVDVPDRIVPFLDRETQMVGQYVKMVMPGAEQHVKSTFVIPGLPKLTGGHYSSVELPAEIARIAQASDPASNTFRVELRLANPGMALRQGIVGRARIAFLKYPEAVLIPMRSIQVTETGPRVLVAVRTEDREVAEVRAIEPVSIDGDQVFISDGVKPGDRLVVSGAKGVVNGEPIRVLSEDGVTIPLDEVDTGKGPDAQDEGIPEADAGGAAP